MALLLLESMTRALTAHIVAISNQAIASPTTNAVSRFTLFDHLVKELLPGLL